MCGPPGNFHQSGRVVAQVSQKEEDPSHLTPHVMLLLRYLVGKKEKEIPDDLTNAHLEALRCCHSYWKV